MHARISKEIGSKRQKQDTGGVVRLGHKSLVSAIGVADIDILQRYSANPLADIVEYLKRDIANLALGNPDNHGQNSTFGKHEDVTIRLSPLFDFTPELFVSRARYQCTPVGMGMTIVPIEAVYARNYP